MRVCATILALALPTLAAAQTSVAVQPDRLAIGGEFVPRSMDLPRVLTVPAGTTATLAPDSTWDYIEVGGTLRVDRARDTTLRFTTLIVLEGGMLDVGTVDDPIPASTHVTFLVRDVPIDTGRDPFQWGNGLLNFGTQSRVGAAKLAFTALTESALRGSTTVSLADDPQGWQVGDALLLPDTGVGGTQRERPVTIAAVSGRIVTLSKPLDVDHLAQTDPDGNVVLWPRIANVTRNIVIRSENPLGTPGHTANIGGAARYTLAYNQLEGLGRTTAQPLDNTTPDRSHIGTNQIAKYAEHDHHVHGCTDDCSAIGNVYHGSGLRKWGRVTHGTHDTLVQDNIAYDFTGAGFVTEDGYEVRNQFVHNLSAYNLGNSDGLMRTELNIMASAPGTEGGGYWFRGVQNTFTANEAWANSVGIDLVNIRPIAGSFPSKPGGALDTPLDLGKMVPLSVRDNVVASNRIFGLEYWGTPKFANTNLVASYNDNAAVLISISNALVPYLLNPTIVAKGGTTSCIHTSTSYTGELFVEGGLIAGCAEGISDGGAQQLTVTGTTFQNVVDLQLSATPSTFLRHVDVVHKPMPGFAKQYIVFGFPTVWSGSGPFPISGRNPFFHEGGSPYVIRNWQGTGQDYQLYEAQQRGSTAAWPSSNDNDATRWGCPDAGITMLECWTRYGIAWQGDTVPDNQAITLEGLVNGFARAGTASPLGPPRFVLTYPTTRDAAPIEADAAGPFVWGYGAVTGSAVGVRTDDVRVSVDGGAPFSVGEYVFDNRRFQLRGTTEGVHEVRTWRVSTAGAVIPSSLMTFHYLAGTATTMPPPPPPPVVPPPPPTPAVKACTGTVAGTSVDGVTVNVTSGTVSCK